MTCCGGLENSAFSAVNSFNLRRDFDYLNTASYGMMCRYALVGVPPRVPSSISYSFYCPLNVFRNLHFSSVQQAKKQPASAGSKLSALNRSVSFCFHTRFNNKYGQVKLARTGHNLLFVMSANWHFPNELQHVLSAFLKIIIMLF